MVIIGGALMPIVGMVFPPLLHLMVHFQNNDNKESGKFHVSILVDVFLIIAGLYISISSIVYSAMKMKDNENHFLDIHVKRL